MNGLNSKMIPLFLCNPIQQLDMLWLPLIFIYDRVYYIQKWHNSYLGLLFLLLAYLTNDLGKWPWNFNINPLLEYFP